MPPPRLRRLLPIFVFAATFVSSSSLAWGPEGHRIVAHIAEQRLTTQALERIDRLLKPGERLSDNSVCNWPDYIRHDQPETAAWHFVDIPFGAANYDAARDCPTGQCIVAEIAVLTATLQNPDARLRDRARALRFLVHFVADLHQPLHCISRDDDRGGNLRTIRFPNQTKETNLHAVWDMSLVHAALGTNDSLTYAEALSHRITERDETAWTNGTIADWAIEGHDIAVSKTYSGIPPVGGPPFPLTQEYVDLNRLVVEDQLMKAGVRLATVLNQALK